MAIPIDLEMMTSLEPAKVATAEIGLESML